MDRVRAKRLVLVLGTLVLAVGAVLLWLSAAPVAVYTAEFLIGGSGPILAPTLAAVTMGLVGVRLFDRQFGKNQSFNAAGNVASALLIALVSHILGGRVMFVMAAVLALPTILSVLSIRKDDIDCDLARGLGEADKKKERNAQSFVTTLRNNRVLLVFLTCAFLFHLSKALPAVMITSPGDLRLLMDAEAPLHSAMEGVQVRAKVWATSQVRRVCASFGNGDVELKVIGNTQVWEGFVPSVEMTMGELPLRVWAEDTTEGTGEDTIKVAFGTRSRSSERKERDRDNALMAWPEHGLLGTQLGPNKNGRKW